MNITFDSNVWERAVNEDKHHFVKIKNKIRDGKMRAYICEIALSLESIRKKLRPEFFENYEPSTTFEVLPTENGEFHMRACFKPNVELHPGLHSNLKVNLLKARDLGFHVLRMTNFGTVRTQEIPDDMYVNHADIDEFWEYAELLAGCSDYIRDWVAVKQPTANLKKNLTGLGRSCRVFRLYQLNIGKDSRNPLRSGLTVTHFQHTTQQVMISFAQTTRLGMRGLDPYFILKIGLHWKKNLVSK